MKRPTTISGLPISALPGYMEAGLKGTDISLYVVNRENRFLYLSKRLVEEHGGRVWVEDRVPGDHTKGARFIVSLPAMAETVDIGHDGL